jgi:hypothetical protein
MTQSFFSHPQSLHSQLIDLHQINQKRKRKKEDELFKNMNETGFVSCSN